MKPSGPGVQSVHSRLRVTSLIALLTVTGEYIELCSLKAALGTVVWTVLMLPSGLLAGIEF
jgi:hypothetical protein